LGVAKFKENRPPVSNKIDTTPDKIHILSPNQKNPCLQPVQKKINKKLDYKKKPTKNIARSAAEILFSILGQNVSSIYL